MIERSLRRNINKHKYIDLNNNIEKYQLNKLSKFYIKEILMFTILTIELTNKLNIGLIMPKTVF